MDGHTHWWMPHHSFKLISGDTFENVGALLESKVRTKWPVTYTTKTAAVVKNQSIMVDYVGGSFRGCALWTFEETDHKTKIACHWQTDPAGSLRPVARFLPVAKSHSHVTAAGFDNLETFLTTVDER